MSSLQLSMREEEPQRQKANTAYVKITCSIDPGYKTQDYVIGWSGHLTWKQGGFNKMILIADTIENLVGNVSSVIRDVLHRKNGKIKKVNVMFTMPSGSETKLTIAYEEDRQIQAALKDSRDGDLNCYE